MKKTKIKNKRKCTRHVCTVPIEGQSGSVFFNTHTFDISRYGLGFISSKQIPIDQKIGVALDLSQKEDPVFVLAEVKWVEPIEDSRHFRVGMKFADVLDGTQASLNKSFPK